MQLGQADELLQGARFNRLRSLQAEEPPKLY
jgi:hypothetical protein